MHTVRGTSGHVSDIAEGNSLLHGQETLGFGDAGYQGLEKRPDAKTGIILIRIRSYINNPLPVAD